MFSLDYQANLGDTKLVYFELALMIFKCMWEAESLSKWDLVILNSNCGILLQCIQKRKENCCPTQPKRSSNPSLMIQKVVFTH